MSNSFFDVTAEDILKVAHWVYDNGGDESIWKALQGYSESKQLQEEREGRIELVADEICREEHGTSIDKIESARRQQLLTLGEKIISTLDDLAGRDEK